ncbi:elongation factor 4 [Candidatus Uhrbacteria bacterium]|nr:elongation factor 4 [Candidatus Uhrbacteria bacterium]
MSQEHIRNFCIIAHIDHGKSTLADRLLELTGTVSKREMKEQLLDSMDLERERGITIKLTPVRMKYNPQMQNAECRMQNNANNILHSSFFILNLIDTPGHVDFTYEVSRSLAAVEGAILLVDATQGIQAQTIANLHLALEQHLTIIPVVNKIDLPNAMVERTRDELIQLLGCDANDILTASGKTGAGVAELLQAIVVRIPPPQGQPMPLRALIFDSSYDDYRGVIAYVRCVDGSMKKGDTIRLMATEHESVVLEVGVFSPKYTPVEALGAGEIGYIVTGLKDLRACRVGDTITTARSQKPEARSIEPLAGYKEVKPMVYAGVFPKSAEDAERLREGLLRLRLSDAALAIEPEHSDALGFGFRCGFLGLLHLDIVQERLRREHHIDVVVTVPSVAYRMLLTSGEERVIRSPQELVDPSHIRSLEEPWVKLDLICPHESIGALMQLATERRGVYVNTEYLGGGTAERALLHYELPLAQILVDFYDRLKSATQGYGSLAYEFFEYREASIVRLDILVAEDIQEALATLVYEDEAQRVGRRIVEVLKEKIPRQAFEVKLQAAIGGKIIASERIPAMRKDVLAKLSGGDVTRKRKLLDIQKRGKKKMAAMGKGSVDIPSDAFLAVLKR